MKYHTNTTCQLHLPAKLKSHDIATYLSALAAWSRDNASNLNDTFEEYLSDWGGNDTTSARLELCSAMFREHESLLALRRKLETQNTI